METVETKNAIITSLIWDTERGLSCHLMLDYGGAGQGFGGFVLYTPKGWKANSHPGNYCGHFLWRIMEIAGVSDLKDLPGKTIRVRGTFSSIESISHIIKDDWFNPKEEFAVISAQFNK